MSVKKIVKKYWDSLELKDKQLEIITQFIDNKDVVGLLPTGYGKSLCYLVPPLVTKKVIFIISPLISLMDDQKEKLIRLSIPVSTQHSNNPERHKELYKIIDGEINIVYMSPEYMQGDGLELANQLFEDGRLGYFAIDESHCVSSWGHDFRSDYLKLKSLRKYFPSIPILAVTATATIRVVEEIITNLSLNKPSIIRANFDRPNLYLKCVKVKTISIDLLDPYIQKYRLSKIIIYVNSRADTLKVSKEINKIYGNISMAYNAGMEKLKRTEIQEEFSKDSKTNIIVSTIAFGMGIDQEVGCVIIFGAPSSIEEYYQQIGRAGRDGNPADTILFFQYQNVIIKEKMLIKESGELLESKQRCLKSMIRYFNTTTCRRRFILEYFDQIPKFFCCTKCDNCCEKELVDYTDKIKQVVFDKKPMSIFTIDEIEQLKEANLLDRYGSYTNILKNWIKLLTLNNKVVNTPDKYKIKL
jgi:RecQ family ATP-dependent DNA helicase